MQIIEIKDKKTRDEFLETPSRLNRTDKNYIRPLDSDVEAVFDRNRSEFFRRGEAVRYILVDSSGVPHGRIAAFIRKSTLNGAASSQGGVGFFECTNDPIASSMLFGQCEKWLKERGAEYMEGPINFGERNMWWGCLVEGFTQPVYGMNYNPPYYRHLFEAYGFKESFRQQSYSVMLSDPIPERYLMIADKVIERGGLRIAHARKRDFSRHVEEFRTVFNSAWSTHPGFEEMSHERASDLFSRLRPIMVEELVWFGYARQRPVAFILGIPDFNQALKRSNGKGALGAYLLYSWLRIRKKLRKAVVAAFGVYPEFRKKGIEAALLVTAFRHLQNSGNWDELELAWIGDFNKTVIISAQRWGKKIKSHITYIKEFLP